MRMHVPASLHKLQNMHALAAKSPCLCPAAAQLVSVLPDLKRLHCRMLLRAHTLHASGIAARLHPCIVTCAWLGRN